MTHLSRRSLLRSGLQGAAAAVGAGYAMGRAAAMEPASTRPLAASPWRKRGVILEPKESWEHDDIQNFTSPVEPLDDGRWRFWYSASGSRAGYTIACAEGVPGGPMKRYPVQRSPGEPADAPFALGNLPDKWNPTQVIHLRLKNGRHRIYFWAHGPGILRYLAADSDDGRRYRVVDPQRPVLYHFHDRAAAGVASPDGVLLQKKPSGARPADEPIAPSHLISNDATTLYQLDDGTFEMYSVALVGVAKDDPAYVAEDNAPGLLRVVDRYVSQDGLRFEGRKRVIQRDAADPVDMQFYYLSVTYTPKGRVGMLGHYRCRAQTMDLEWCFSADGLKWERPRRTAWIPRGDKTEPDSYGIYAPHGLVFRDGLYHLFYTAVNSAHNGRHSYGPPRQVVMHATIPSIL